MSKVENKGRVDYSKFDNIDSDILEAYLRADLNAPEGKQMEPEAISYIIELLSERQKDNQIDWEQKTAKAVAEFQEDCLPYINEAQEIYDFYNDFGDDNVELKPDNNKKIVYHAHSTEEDFKNSFMFSNSVSGVYKKWLINLYTKGDYIITPTPYSKGLLESYGISIPIKAISNGVDLKQFNPTEEQIRMFINEYNIKSNEVIIISVGWLFERKGFDTFVEVAEKLPDYKFMWFGDVKLSRPTKKIKTLLDKLPSNVILPGYVSGDIIKGAYGRSNVFFFPSREETEGIVVLEALACKCNILLRDIPVFSKWLENGVNCYKGNDTDDFVELINKIVLGKSPSLVNNGYEVAKERELSRIGKELLEVYEETLRL